MQRKLIVNDGRSTRPCIALVRSTCGASIRKNSDGQAVQRRCLRCPESGNDTPHFHITTRKPDHSVRWCSEAHFQSASAVKTSAKETKLYKCQQSLCPSQSRVVDVYFNLMSLQLQHVGYLCNRGSQALRPTDLHF